MNAQHKCLLTFNVMYEYVFSKVMTLKKLNLGFK